MSSVEQRPLLLESAPADGQYASCADGKPGEAEEGHNRLATECLERGDSWGATLCIANPLFGHGDTPERAASCCGRGHGELASPGQLGPGGLAGAKYRLGGTALPAKQQQGASPLPLLGAVARSDQGDPDALVTTKIFVAGICCPSEVPIIHNVLERLPGVCQVEVAVVTKRVEVHHAPALISPATLVAALNEAQLEASLTFPRQQAKAARSWVPPPLTLLSLALLLVSLLGYLAAPTGVAWLAYLKWVSLGAVVVGSPPIALKAWGALKGKVLDIHMLMVIAVAGAIALGEFTEAAAVVVLFSLSDFLEGRCSGQARDAIAAVLSMRPEVAVLAACGREVPAADVEVGALILVKPGARVPLDGTIERGSSALDESMLTGEPTPVTKGPGSSVSAGSLNVGGSSLTVRTTAAAGDSAVARMAALVEKATSEQSPTETLVARFAKFYTPAVVLACLCMVVIPWAAGSGDLRWWAYLSLELLVTACPCALVISTPVTVVSAVARSARMGALVKGGAHLERLAKVGVMTFDKTGTLTVGSFRLAHVELGAAAGDGSPEAFAAGELTEREVLRLVGSLERGSSHPIAAAIVGRAAAQAVSCDAAVESSEQLAGCGLLGRVERRSLVVGTAELLASRGVADTGGRMRRAVAEWGPRGVTLCHVAVDGTYAGFLCAQDAPRPEAAEALRQLEALGVSAAMLTGDGRGVARAVAAATGVRPGHVHASLLPRDKLDLVAAYQRQADRHTCVAHVGDGANDAPALAAADVGIAMGVAGSAAAVEAGDVALFSNDLRLLPALVALSRRARGKIVENIALAVVSKLAVLTLASLSLFTLWGAVLVDVGAALVVTLNGISMLYWRRGQYDNAQGAGASCSHHAGCSSRSVAAAAGSCGGSGGHSHAAGGGCCGHKHKHRGGPVGVHACGGGARFAAGGGKGEECGRLLEEGLHHPSAGLACCGIGTAAEPAVKPFCGHGSAPQGGCCAASSGGQGEEVRIKACSHQSHPCVELVVSCGEAAVAKAGSGSGGEAAAECCHGAVGSGRSGEPGGGQGPSCPPSCSGGRQQGRRLADPCSHAAHGLHGSSGGVGCCAGHHSHQPRSSPGKARRPLQFLSSWGSAGDADPAVRGVDAPAAGLQGLL